MLLSQFLPWALTPLLMVGGTYLCFEGAEKIWERLSHHSSGHGSRSPPKAPTMRRPWSPARSGPTSSSTEIMVIALNEVATEPFVRRLLVLVFVAFVITAGVYGVVALIVKMDDIGLALAERRSGLARAVGTGLVRAMPRILSTLAIVGTVAMLWVGGHILLVGADDLGWPAPYALVHHAEEAVLSATSVGAGLADQHPRLGGRRSGRRGPCRRHHPDGAPHAETLTPTPDAPTPKRPDARTPERPDARRRTPRHRTARPRSVHWSTSGPTYRTFHRPTQPATSHRRRCDYASR